MMQPSGHSPDPHPAMRTWSWQPDLCIYASVSLHLSTVALTHPVAKMEQLHSLTKIWASQPHLLGGQASNYFSRKKTSLFLLLCSKPKEGPKLDSNHLCFCSFISQGWKHSWTRTTHM